MKSKKLIILTQYFPPEVGAPQNRLYELALHLQRAGLNIIVLTAMPNYPQMKKYEGYRWKIYKKEAMAYGCVPIVSDIPANREWIKHLENGIILNKGANIVGSIKQINSSHVFDLNRMIILNNALFPEKINQFFKIYK
jgi:hypothetical protein